jgi:hypothetical protein
MPTSSKLVIVDERGGAPLTVDLAARWVSRLRMIRGAAGPAAPQLAIETCPTPKPSSCEAELLTLIPEAPLRITARHGGSNAAAAIEGHLDSGRRLDVAGQRTSCRTALRVRDSRGAARLLPGLPPRHPTYRRCNGLVGRFIVGRYAFVTVRREDREHDFTADFLYGIDLTKRASARWRGLYAPYSNSPGSTGLALGPGVTDHALYWETTDSETESTVSLDRVLLPRDLERRPTRNTPTTTGPVAPDTADECEIVATDDAIYELANPRCSTFPGRGTGGEIRRLTNPKFRPTDT